MLDAPIGAARAGELAFLTEAFIKAGTRFTLLEFTNGVAVDAPDGAGVIRIGGKDRLYDSARLARPRHASDPRTAPPPRPHRPVAGPLPPPTRPPARSRVGAASASELGAFL